MSRFSRIVASGSATVALLFTGAAWAGSLTTIPFPGYRLVSGRIHCAAVNVGDKPAELTEMVLRGTAGGPYETVGPVTVAPLEVVTTADRDLASSSPAFCTFRFKGKFKGALEYWNGTEAAAVPASK